MLPQEFRDDSYYQLRRNYVMIMLPLFHGNIILLKEKWGMRVLTASVGHMSPNSRRKYTASGRFFFPSLLTKPVLPKTNSFFSFSFLKLWVRIAQQPSIYANCFMGRQDTPWAILSQKCMLWERGLVKLPQPRGLSLI